MAPQDGGSYAYEPPKASREEACFTPEELILIQEGEIPHHVAIIMDGNRRWSKKEVTKSYIYGYRAGGKALTRVVVAAQELGISVLTVFGFSTENWHRPEEEVVYLMHLFEASLREQRAFLQRRGVRFHVIGDLSSLSPRLREEIDKTEEETRGGASMDLVVALNYGGRNEVTRVCLQLVQDVMAGILDRSQIEEQLVNTYFDTASWPDPDLLIRTGGEKRISNFLLWQIAYSEVYFSDTLWPDFSAQDLWLAIMDFQHRRRRLGR